MCDNLANMAESLNQEQKLAVEHGNGPLLIVAGAGTGKTTVLKERFKYLVNSGKANPDEILCLVFNDEAARHLEERIIEENFEWAYTDLSIHTFHAFCDKVLRQHPLEAGVCEDYTILSESYGWILMRKNFEKFKFNYYKSLGNSAKFLSPLLSHFKECKEEGIYPDVYQEYAQSLRCDLTTIGKKDDLDFDLSCAREEFEKREELAGLFAMYQKLLFENNVLDFGDLLNYCLNLFKKSPAILKKYRNRYKYVLVDEFQDTNRIQYELVKIISFPKNNLTVVGDDDQSIYRFRGAVLENVLDFCQDFPDSRKIVLKTNYRSCQNILDLAYMSICQNNPNRLECFIATNKEILESFKASDAPLVEMKKLKAGLDLTGQYEIWHEPTAEKEINRIIEKIKELKANWQKTKCEVDYKYPDYAILTRTNALAQKVCMFLARAGLDYRFLASKGFYQKSIIIEALSYLRLLDNFHEHSAVYKVLRSKVFDFSEDDISILTEYCKKKTISLYESLKESSIAAISPAGIAKSQKLISLIEKHRELLKKRLLSEVFTIFLEDAGYFKWLLALEKENQSQALENIALLRQFLEQIKEFEETQVSASLVEFLEQVNFEIESGDKGTIKSDMEQGSPDQIQVMTIHKAKGLEFNHVFLPNLVQRHFPGDMRSSQIEIPDALISLRQNKNQENALNVRLEGEEKDFHLQEERRLFYVCLTRARIGLYLSYADKEEGLKNIRQPSKFLVELDLAQAKKAEKDKKIGIESLKPINQTNYPVKSVSEEKAISYSQLAAFSNCPYQYKLAYLLKIPKRGQASTTFGNVIHTTIEQFVRDIAVNKGTQGQIFEKADIASTNIPDLKELLRIYDKKWVDEWFESKSQKEEYKKKGYVILEKFYSDFIANQTKILMLGQEPALEVKFNANLGGVAIYGKIDRIDDLGNNEIAIVDYKTGSPKTKLDSDAKDQLLMYQAAALQTLGKVPKSLTYYFLEDGSKLTFLGKDEEIEKLGNKLNDFKEQLRGNDFKASPGHHCQWCDFYDICEFRD